MRNFANSDMVVQNYHTKYNEQINYHCDNDKNYGHYDRFNQEPELARAYVPYQEMHELYPPKKALRNGTVFPELYRPY